MNGRRLILLALVAGVGCSSVVIRPANTLVKIAPPLVLPANAAILTDGLSKIIAQYQQSPEVYPENCIVAGLMGSALATMSFVVADLGEWVIDQQSAAASPWSRGIPANLSVDVACQPARHLALWSSELPRNAFLHKDVGNPPDLHFVPVWFPVERAPNLNAPPVAAGPLLSAPCPAAPGVGPVCLQGRMALQPQAAPLVIIVPGLLESSSFHHVRNTATALYSLGLSVVILDMRDHGVTFQAQPDVPTTLGIYEGRDLSTVADELRLALTCAPQIQRIGLLGFSAGATFALRAFLDDRAYGGARFDGGVLAASPVLSWTATLAAMSDTGSDGTGATWSWPTHINSNATAYFFMELLRQHIRTMHFAEPKHIDPRRDYLDARHLPKPGSVPDAKGYQAPEDAIAPQRLAQQFAQLAPVPASATGYAPFAAIVVSDDDEVIGQEPVSQFLKALDRAKRPAFNRSPTAPAPVAVYRPKFGGHISFAVVSNSLARRFLRYYFLHE